MLNSMEATVAVKSSKSAEGKAMSAAVTATDKARGMILEIGGPRTWNDTKESWRARVARTVRLTPRRVRAILANEPIRLSADEYLDIERAYEVARASVATISNMARDADVRARGAIGSGGGQTVRQGEQPDNAERPRAHASI
jgi:hypothetical protein